MTPSLIPPPMSRSPRTAGYLACFRVLRCDPPISSSPLSRPAMAGLADWRGGSRYSATGSTQFTESTPGNSRPCLRDWRRTDDCPPRCRARGDGLSRRSGRRRHEPDLLASRGHYSCRTGRSASSMGCWCSPATMLFVFGLLIFFAVRYRRGSSAKRGPLPEIVSREFEIGWTSATLFLFAFLFWWAASADLSSLSAPANALEIHVVAKQWMWKTQHSNGAREINALHVPGRPAGAAGDDVAGRHPLVLRSCVSGQTGRAAGPRHRDLVSRRPRPASFRCSALNIAAPTTP